MYSVNEPIYVLNLLVLQNQDIIQLNILMFCMFANEYKIKWKINNSKNIRERKRGTKICTAYSLNKIVDSLAKVISAMELE